jgi:hypothetical protein
MQSKVLGGTPDCNQRHSSSIWVHAKKRNPNRKNKTKMERNDTHRQRSETFNSNSHGGDQPSYRNKHHKTNENRVMQPNAGHPKAYERRRGLTK